MEPYRLDEVTYIWGRLAEQASGSGSPVDATYHLVALRIVEARARRTETAIAAYSEEQRRSLGTERLAQVTAQLANIRHAARAAHRALALRAEGWRSLPGPLCAAHAAHIPRPPLTRTGRIARC